MLERGENAEGEDFYAGRGSVGKCSGDEGYGVMRICARMCDET
jgi:hypothetical protein